MNFKATAPGSLMLLGEYAVLHNKPAIVCAVDKRISVTLTPRNDQAIIIDSASLGHYKADLAQLIIERPFHFVLGTIKYYQQKLRRGCHIEITADFSDQMGFGSSAAVTVATMAALLSWLELKVSLLDMLRDARQIIRQIQGIGSGADAAAAIYGGVMAYQQQPLHVEKFTATYPLTVLYSGFKTPTVEAIQQVDERFVERKILFRYLIAAIGQCAADSILHLRQANWQQVGELMNVQQGLMEALGVNVPALQMRIDELRQSPHILGTKISGSGLGDCVVGLGEADTSQKIQVAISSQGVLCEKN